MFSTKVKVVLKTVTINPVKKIGVIFWVAVAIRKFQKYDSEKFKNSIEYYFELQAVMEELKSLFTKDEPFIQHQIVKLAYFIRKFSLTIENVESIACGRANQLSLPARIYKHLEDGCRSTSNSAMEEQLQYFMCVSLKHLIRNSKEESLVSFLTISETVKLISGCNNDLVKNELIFMLAYCVEKSNEVLTNKVCAELKYLVSNLSVAQETKAFFLSKLETSKAITNHRDAIKQEGHSGIRNSSIRNVRKSKQVVTKTIQTVKSKQENKRSEETDFIFLNFSDAMKNRNRQQIRHTILESVETVEDKSGHDRSVWRSTWAEILNLHKLAVLQNQVLKNDDKDNYLPAKFLGVHYFFTEPEDHTMYSFFINRMCASIFMKISRKQQLNHKAVDKLLKCVTDFKNFVLVLHLGEDYVDMFACRVLVRYWELKQLTAPEIIGHFVKKLMAMTSEELLIVGWVYNSYNVKRKSINHAELKLVIMEEINMVRQNAVKALYNCAIRDKKILTKDRVKEINGYLTNSYSNECYHDSIFTDHIWKLMELAEATDDFDYESTFQAYIRVLNCQLINKTESKENIKVILRFLNNQAKDSKRSQQLFCDDVLGLLIRLLGTSSALNYRLKEDLMEIINIYLEHEQTKAISETNLELLMRNTIGSNDSSFINTGLTSLLLLSEKDQLLTQDAFQKLVQYYNLLCFNENHSNFMLLILSRAICSEAVQSPYFLTNLNDVEIISHKLLSDYIVLLDDDNEDGLRMIFEKFSEGNRHNSSHLISLLAANIILRSSENRISLSSKTIDNLLMTLNSTNAENKQTKIVAAKCLYNLQYASLGSEHLSQLLNLINSDVYDVGIYVQAAYIKGCVNVALSDDRSLDVVHLENISSLYISESLRLGQHDYETEINNDFFATLLYESRKQPFCDKNIFFLFDSILGLNKKYADKTLEVLIIYSRKFFIPETTVRILEDILCFPEHFGKALLIIQNLIFSSQSSVTTKTLNIFVDNLYISSNSRQRLMSFKLLEKVSKRQDLADDIFYKFELAKAGFALSCVKLKEPTTLHKKLEIINFISRQTDKGMQLPIDTMQALGQEINHPGVIKIFYNITKNKQILEWKLLNTLGNMFNSVGNDERESNILLIGLFENALKNNQALPKNLLLKFEKTLELCKKDCEQKLLPIFIYLAQKGERLSKPILNKLLQRLMDRDYLSLKQELLSSLGSIIEANKDDISCDQWKTINQILINELKSDNFSIQKLCILAVEKLATVAKRLNYKLLDQFVQLGINYNTNTTIKSEIQLIFESIDAISINNFILNKSYREKMQLANLSCNTDDELLSKLNCSVFLSLKEGLLPQNYNQLKQIIDKNDAKLQEESLNILHKCKAKSKIADVLLESVAMLYESTTSGILKTSSLELLLETACSGKTLTGRAFAVWDENKNWDENFKKFFHCQLYQALRLDFQLNDKDIADMVKLLQRSKKLLDIDAVNDLIDLIVKENSVYFECQSFVMLVEQSLIKKEVKESTLSCYCRIIREQKYIQVTECLQALTEQCINRPDATTNFVAHLVEAMHCAIKFIQLPDKCLQLIEDNLDNGSEIIRGYSFRTLRMIAGDDRYPKSNKFDDCCNKMLDNLLQNAEVKIEKSKDYLDLLEILISVRFIDVDVFRKMKRNIWKRELVVSSIFENFNVQQIVQVDFYNSWALVEEKFSYHKSAKILSMISMSHFDSIAQIIELFSILPEIGLTFDEITRTLSISKQASYQVFKHEWCMTRIQDRLTDDNGINETFLNKLVVKLCESFDVQFISRMLCSIKLIDNLAAFYDLIDFCLRKKVQFDDLTLADTPLNNLKCWLEAKQLCKQVRSRPRNETDERKLTEILQNLLNQDWNFIQLSEFVDSFNLQKYPTKFHYVIQLFSTILQYKLSFSSSGEMCKHILMEAESFTDSIKGFNKLAINNHFQIEGKIKDVSELFSELQKSNPNLFAADCTMINSLKLKLELLKSECASMTKEIFDNGTAIFNWNEKQISLWSKEVKKNKKSFSDCEAIAVINRANFLITGQTLTDTQLLCSLIALEDKNNLKGKLLQVATGEGKSTIVCILAIINGLRGKQVHVISSSPVLAERDAKQKAKLFRMFNLTCSDNNDKTVYLKGLKDCYKADIIYGELSQFQFDVLRDNYSKLGTLGNRKCSTVIVDEVDSMLIDDSSKIARLSSTAAGMEHFQVIYVLIWQRLLSMKQKFISFNNKMYFIDGKVGFENEKITLEIFDDSDNNSIVKIPDLESYLLNTKDICRIGEIVGDDLEDYLKKSLGNYLDSQLNENKIYIPSNFTEFVQRQKTKWIFNAIEALNYQENVHYVVQDGQIKPVDYSSTGIVQSSTNWSDGLHQFLQLKHNLNMTSETFTTNFLSNIGFINGYNKVCGLTGTLGSKTARNLLKSVYKVELVNIPQRRQKQFLEWQPLIAQNEAQWLKEITSTTMLEIKKERGILIICETIAHANRISEILKHQHRLRSSAVKLYTMNDTNQERNVEKVLSGEVIIATNLAGRGTDIQTDEIEHSGGLHVILTFMPSNQRVEDQAFGRTARQGKRGTGCMILNARNLEGYAKMTKEVKEERDITESVALQEFEKNELKLIRVKDNLFEVFCHFLNDYIRAKIRKQETSSIRQLTNSFVDVLPTVYESNILAAAEEQWAMFLHRLEDGTIKLDAAEKECNALIKQLQNNFENQTLIKNPYYFTCIAYDVIVNDWWTSDVTKARRALDYFKKAIALDHTKTGRKWLQIKNSDADELVTENTKKMLEQTGSDISGNNKTVQSAGAAHFGVAWCSLLLRDKDYKETALASLNNAMLNLSNEMSLLNTMQIILEQKQVGFGNSALYNQLNVKATILGTYLNSVQGCIEAIKRSLRLIDVVATQKYKTGNNVLEKVMYYKEQQRDLKSIFKSGNLKLSSKETYSLQFNDLTSTDDNGTTDQAVITLRNAFDKNNAHCLDYSSYCDIQIKLKQVDLDHLRQSIFNPNKEFKDLTKEAAMAKLKEERTYLNAMHMTSSFRADLKITSRKAKMPQEESIEAHSREFGDKQITKHTETIKSLASSSFNNTTETSALVDIMHMQVTNMLEDIVLKGEFKDRQINEIIKIIENQPSVDETLHFDIIIKNSNENEINKCFKSKTCCENSIKLDISFDNVDQNAAKAKLSAIKAKSVHIEMTLEKFSLAKLILENEELSAGILCLSDHTVFEKVDRKELLQRVNKLKTDDSYCYIKFENLDIDHAKKLVEKCHQSATIVFAITFFDVDDFNNSGLDNGQVNFYFSHMKHKTAETVIDVLRKQNFPFSLVFKNLNDRQVKCIVQNAHLVQEDIEIKKVKILADAYMTGTVPRLELAELAAKGIEHFIEIDEMSFIPWRSIMAVVALGTGQMIIGGLLIYSGFGLTVGKGLLTEGLADMFTAFRAYQNRSFHWSDYCKQKAISLVISVMSAGYSKYKQGLQDAVKGVETLVAEVGIDTFQQTAKNVVSQGQAVGQTMMKTRANLKSLAVKIVGVNAGEAVTRECLNTGIQFLSGFSFELLKPKICESIQWRVGSSFSDTNLMRLLRKMYAIDLATGSHQLQSRVQQIVVDSINPRHDFMREQWESIGLPLLKGILSDSSHFGSTFSMSIRIIGTLNGLNEVQVLVQNVVKELISKLGLVEKHSMTISLVLHQTQKLDKDSASIIVNKWKQLNILDDFENFKLSRIDEDDDCGETKRKIVDLACNWSQNTQDILHDLNAYGKMTELDLNKSMDFLKTFYEQFIAIDLESFSNIIKAVSDALTEQLIRIIDSQLLQPWSTLAVSQVTDSFSRQLQHSYLVDPEQNSVNHKMDQSKYEELKNKEEPTPEEVAFINNYGKFRSIAEQISYNASEFCISYSQCEILYYASNKNTGGIKNEKVKQAADDVRNGKPTNIAIMIIIAKANGINLKVVDDKNYVKTQEDINDGIDVICVERGENNQIGHAYYMNSNGEFINTKSEGDDCTYAALSKILEREGVSKTVGELRMETAEQIELNTHNYSKVLNAENWIREHHPNIANDLLFMAGRDTNAAADDDQYDSYIKDDLSFISGKDKNVAVDDDQHGGKENATLEDDTDEVSDGRATDRSQQWTIDFEYYSYGISSPRKLFDVKNITRPSGSIGLISGSLDLYDTIANKRYESYDWYAGGNFRHIESGSGESIFCYRNCYVEASLAEYHAGFGDLVKFKASALSVSAHAEYGWNNSAGFSASVVKAEAKLGPADFSVGLNFNTNASIGLRSGVSATFLGTGFSIGPRMKLQTPFMEFSVNFF